MRVVEWKNLGAFFQHEGHDIFYIRKGSGSLVLLLHGFPSSSYDWHKMYPSLIERYDFVCLDMLGYGFSDKPLNNHYSIHLQADIVESFLQFLKIESCHILAHDMGDSVANELLARQQSQELSFSILSLCLLNGGLFPGVHKPLFVQWALMTPLGKYIAKFYSFKMFSKAFSKIFGQATQASSEELEEMWYLMNYKEGMKVFPLLIKYMQDRIDNEKRWLKALVTCKLPLRLINGAADPISGLHLVKHYQKVIPNPDVVVLNEIGHYPQMEAPNLVLKHFVEFLSDQGEVSA
ncbi:MAG: alpha/beta hydrolase [Chitinophagales bacterium]|nr:alpha/beta hydrolase [Bacteroidota bacterium]MCB9255809.1 alpha/beta hydrolase [Chitinophagales bacterium]